MELVSLHFLKIIAGVEEPDEGQVVKGKGIELAYLAQTPLYYENENVLEYVMRGKHADSQPKSKKRFLTSLE